MAVQDRRQSIIEAGLATLRKHGYVGFTQPRVAAFAGLRQSHITYYYPTRLDLLAAVGRVAVERLLAAIDAMLATPHSPEAAANAIAELVTRHENTRVLLALAQAGDQEPQLRELFRDLADGVVARLSAFLGRRGGHGASEESARFLHTLSVGVAVVNLATGRPDGEQRAAAVLHTALHLIEGQAGSKRRPAPGASQKRERGDVS